MAALNIVLGSESKSRRAIFERVLAENQPPLRGRRVTLSVLPARIDERAAAAAAAAGGAAAAAAGNTAPSAGGASQYVRLVARAKAAALLPALRARLAADPTPTLLFTADQVVAVDGAVLEKPRTAAEIAANLHRFSSPPFPIVRTVNFIVGVDVGSGRRVETEEIAALQFHSPLSEAEMYALCRERWEDWDAKARGAEKAGDSAAATPPAVPGDASAEVDSAVQPAAAAGAASGAASGAAPPVSAWPGPDPALILYSVAGALFFEHPLVQAKARLVQGTLEQVKGVGEETIIKISRELLAGGEAAPSPEAQELAAPPPKQPSPVEPAAFRKPPISD